MQGIASMQQGNVESALASLLFQVQVKCPPLTLWWPDGKIIDYDLSKESPWSGDWPIFSLFSQQCLFGHFCLKSLKNWQVLPSSSPFLGCVMHCALLHLFGCPSICSGTLCQSPPAAQVLWPNAQVCAEMAWLPGSFCFSSFSVVDNELWILQVKGRCGKYVLWCYM